MNLGKTVDYLPRDVKAWVFLLLVPVYLEIGRMIGDQKNAEILRTHSKAVRLRNII